MSRSRTQGKAKKKKAYAKAGVDIDLGDQLKRGLKSSLREARRPEVMGTVGGFGGLFDLSKSRYDNPVLVSSVEGVGTKLRLAFDSGKHEIVGQDIVNHCIDDIAVLGAEPLFFLDYIGLGKLEPEVFHKLVKGMSGACRDANCALIGGETAQMGDFYQPGEYDLVGCIVGAVEKKKLLSGKTIKPGDQLIGLASNGLHTNGYSLARKIVFEQKGLKLSSQLPGSRTSVLNALLKPHVNYASLMRKLFKKFNKGETNAKRAGNSIFGAVHITGGGFTGNIPRVLPTKCDALVRINSWRKLPIFKFLASEGGIDQDELYEVFNMGIGMVLIVEGSAAKSILEDSRKAGIKAYLIGEVTRGSGSVQWSEAT